MLESQHTPLPFSRGRGCGAIGARAGGQLWGLEGLRGFAYAMVTMTVVTVMVVDVKMEVEVKITVPPTVVVPVWGT